MSGRANAVIVGGGPTGVSALMTVIRSGTAQTIHIVDPLSPGLGTAFGPHCAGDPALLCNSPATLTHLDAEAPEDFLEYLVARGWPVASDDLVPRILFGQYCRERFTQWWQEAERRGVSVVHVPRRAVAVRRFDETYEVQLDAGPALAADTVVLCPGLQAPSLPPAVARFERHPRLLRGAFPVARLRALPRRSRVLILGLRSSAIDAVLTLVRDGHSVVMTSPSGRLSAVRDRIRVPPRSYVERAAWRDLDPDDPQLDATVLRLLGEMVTAVGEGLSVEEQTSRATDAVRRLREEVALAQTGRTRWSDLLVDMIDLLNEVVGSWDSATRARVMPRAHHLLTRYVNALPVLLAEELLGAIDGGAAEVRGTFLESATADDDGWTVTWKDGEEERYDFVVTATGYHFPRFALRDQDTVELADTSTVGDRELAEVTDGLRLRFGAGARDERIWVLGPSTSQRVPAAHVIYLAARQARRVEEDLAAGAAA